STIILILNRIFFSCGGFSDSDITQHNIPELDGSSRYLSLLSLNIDGDVLLGGITIVQIVFSRSTFKSLIDGHYTNVSAIRLSFQITDVVNVIPADVYLVIVKRHQSFKVIADFVIRHFITT